jgi:hypothetical protein
MNELNENEEPVAQHYDSVWTSAQSPVSGRALPGARCNVCSS